MASLSGGDVEQVAAYWGLHRPVRVEPRSVRVTRLEAADGAVYYLKGHGQADSLAALPVLGHLRGQGLRVEEPLRTPGGAILVDCGSIRYALYPELSGRELLVYGSADPCRNARLLGAAIGHLHRALATYPQEAMLEFPVSDLVGDARSWQATLARAGLPFDRALIDCVIDRIIAAALLRPELPRQLVHHDCHRGNILIDECGAPGFLDFDFLRVAVRIFDPCYCLATLLTEGFADEAYRRQWPGLATALLGGYEASCPLGEAERSAVMAVILAAQLTTAGWWAHENQAELAEQAVSVLRWLVETGLPF